jgi:hypothetical protein
MLNNDAMHEREDNRVEKWFRNRYGSRGRSEKFDECRSVTVTQLMIKAKNKRRAVASAALS